MIITTHNIRGLGGNPKFLALKRLFKGLCPDILCVQETMASADRACAYFQRMFPGWKVVAIGAVGLSGGVLCAWNPKVCDLKAFSSSAGILLKGVFRGCNTNVKIFNVYGPFRDREAFWNRLADCGILKDPSLILLGDLNFTLSPTEIWGSSHWDPLMHYFKSLLKDSDLIDLCPIDIGPTWRNGRTSGQGISKRLDRFLMASHLAQVFNRFRVWHVDSWLSDHIPVCLQIDWGQDKISYPFKYNHHWYDNNEFQQLVRSFWLRDHGISDWSPMDRFSEKLRLLKCEVKLWARERKKQDEKELCSIEDDMANIFTKNPLGLYTKEDKVLLSALEDKKIDILKREEEAWRLKSRAIWVRSGDQNTAFFQRYANFRRVNNTVWDIKSADGVTVYTQKELAAAARAHFQEIFSDPKRDNISAQITLLETFPPLVTDEENRLMNACVTLSEIEIILKSCAKDKSPGPDGWNVEFFLQFWDLIGAEVLELVEESRLAGHVSGGLNSTFIALIPKISKATSYNDFRPISLCNFLYKIISKVIAERLKPWLSRVISPEQFGFLKDRQIFDAVGAAQEGIHSIKDRKIKASLMKVDLNKAYDRVDWGYLRLLLLHIGLSGNVVRWIMACVTSVNFAVLVNGSPSGFFKSSRGLRQGCPLSPLLFLLIIEGLSRSISLAKERGFIKGVVISGNLSLTHLLFVDDVLIFGRKCALEWMWYYRIIKEFCLATGMDINYEKSCFYSLDDSLDPDIYTLFPVSFYHFDEGLLYLGYRLKPNCYRPGDWLWLIERIENRIGMWCYRSLSLGGRLTLISSVIESMPVYWMTLHKIPKVILNHIRKLMASFLWSGNHSDKKYHLVKWSNIARPKSLGGWGLKDLETFGKALRMKSLWRFIHSHTIWSQICSLKYLRGVDKESWLMKGLRSWGSASPMWKALLETRLWIQPGLSWLIGSGDGVALQDLRNDGDLDYILSPPLVAYFRLRGYSTLAHFCTHSSSIIDHWKDSSYFHLNGEWKYQWDRFISSLQRLGIRLSGCVDRLFWCHNPLGKITAKSAFLHLSSVSGPGDSRWWDLSIWRLGAPLKIVCFFWLLMNSRILTWEQLCKRGWSGPGYCVLCKMDSEDINHLFIHCPVTNMIWQYVCDELHIAMSWRYTTLTSCFDRWSTVHKRFKSLPLFICWGVWLLRNGILFEDRVLNWVITGIKILSLFKDFIKGLQPRKIRVDRLLDTDFELVGFFDGAAVSGRGGCGFILYLNRNHVFHGWTGLLNSTNNLAEIFAVWTLLHWARILNLNNFKIFGDSRLVINWLNGTSHIQAKNLVHHCSNIRTLVALFDQVSFQHVYRQHNMIADRLSKKGLASPEGLLQIEELENNRIIRYSTHRLFS